jgi:hypothetical protein
MALSWIRLDANIASHDKILNLLADPSTSRWQAVSVYVFALGWSGAHGTDGFVPRNALGMVHGTPKIARLLEKYHLWIEATAGWKIVNFAERQQLSAVTEGKKQAQRLGAIKANCQRWHGDSCGCWKAAAQS